MVNHSSSRASQHAALQAACQHFSTAAMPPCQPGPDYAKADKLKCRNRTLLPGSLLTPWSSFLYLSCSMASLSLQGVTPRPGFWLSVLCLVLSGLSSAFIASPEDLENGSGVLVLLALSVADLSRILAAACVGIALARYITSVGVVLIIVLAAIASDLFSVFAGPTRVLVQEDSPILDALLLVFPTFGSALGFSLGVSDLIFLALRRSGPFP